MAEELTTILLIGRRQPLHRRLLEMLRNCGLYVMEVNTIEQSRSLLRERTIPLIFCEDRLEDGTYRDLLAAIRRLPAEPARVVVLSHTGEVGDYLDAMQLGAFDFLSPPVDWKQVENILARASRRESSAAPVAADKASAA